MPRWASSYLDGIPNVRLLAAAAAGRAGSSLLIGRRRWNNIFFWWNDAQKERQPVYNAKKL